MEIPILDFVMLLNRFPGLKKDWCTCAMLCYHSNFWLNHLPENLKELLDAILCPFRNSRGSALGL